MRRHRIGRGQKTIDKRSRHRHRREVRQMVLEQCESRRLLTTIPSLLDIAPATDSNPSDFLQLGEFTLFVADDGTHGRELWRTDGTVDGTELVIDLNDGVSSSQPSQLTEFDGFAYFAADDGVNGRELWRTDGTAGGTTLFADLHDVESSNPSQLTVAGSQLFFTADDATRGNELWTTDGTTNGTMLVRNVMAETNGSPLSSTPQHLVNVDGVLYFSADDGLNGRELWKSDGTEGGTVLVRDVYPGADSSTSDPLTSNPTHLTDVDGTLFFVAETDTGRELWMSDGTEAGTTQVIDLRDGAESSFSSVDLLLSFQGDLFFTADDGTTGRELWRSNGTEAGTQRISDIAAGSGDGFTGESIVPFAGRLYFTANNLFDGHELWSTDGTLSGTEQLVNLAEEGLSASPSELTVVGDRLYFAARTDSAGRELWETDGTVAGTVLVDDLASGAADSDPQELFAFGSLLLFAATDPISGRELFVADSIDAIEARLTIYVGSQFVVIPANVGIASNGDLLSPVHSLDAQGNLRVRPIDGGPVPVVTVGDFFTTWHTNGGAGGSNEAAHFSATELMASTVDSDHTITMFVNGQLSTDYEAHVIEDGDEIILVYGENPVISINTNFGPIVMELFEDQAPGTVTNLLNYVNDGDYDNSIFHRSAKTTSGSDFVVQGGGFTTNSSTFTSLDQFVAVPVDDTIPNEPGLSNVRGTVAMAKRTGEPDSATSQFFVNLSDANAFLDLPQNNAFTVFAEVLDMTTVDTIAALPRDTTNAPPFAELPVSDGTLVVVQSIVGNGSIEGTKYLDTNENGTQDEGELGLSDMTVFLDTNANGLLDDREVSTLTDSDGRYRFDVAPGTYLVGAEVSTGSTVTEPSGNTGLRNVVVGLGRTAADVDFGEAMLDAPTTIDLVDASDTGSSSTDNITNHNDGASDATLRFLVSGVVVGADVRLFVDGTQVASGVAASDSIELETSGTVALSDGDHEIQAVQVVNGNASGTSTPLTITVDTSPPSGITNTLPNTAQVGQLYTFDVNSPDEGPTTSYHIENGPAGMTVDNDGVIDWTPVEAEIGQRSFDIVLEDSAGNTTSHSATVEVLAQSTGAADSYTVVEDQTLSVSATNGVLANDSNPGGGAITVGS